MLFDIAFTGVANIPSSRDGVKLTLRFCSLGAKRSAADTFLLSISGDEGGNGKTSSSLVGRRRKFEPPFVGVSPILSKSGVGLRRKASR